jgi:predicted Holliday junction resolvase-like endonuclease
MQVDGKISSLLSFYKHERQIFGRCPSCGNAFRLSEVKLTYGKQPPKDIVTRMKAERDRLLEKLQQLEDDIEAAEDEHQFDLDAADEKWKAKLSVEVEKQLVRERKDIRKNAIARARAGQLGKTLEKVVPMFPRFGHHPYDVRPIFDPIDFVVFDGYFQGKVTDITFVEFKTGQSRLSGVQESIRETVERKRVRFELRRLSREAIKSITSANPPRQVQELLE